VSTTSNFTLQSTNNGDFYANQVSSAEQNCLVSFKDVDIGFLKSEDSRFHHIILKNVTFDIPKTSVTMIIGPVGAGKTTLVRTILGELPCLKGYINCLITRIGYCSQTPWIPYGTIRQVITGKDEEENLDEDWYNMVIRACELLPDITSLPNYDKTIVGSRGVTLSGGQKQRLALARAVYNRPTLLLLDDVFSPLDKTTQTSLFENLIGTNGILKKFEGTAILVTKNGKHVDKMVAHLLI
jgi:ABC-type multidrug transport system fused ATPase/permease subunit